ncbi:hypothetical protein SELMODRAFT_409680 [Selaginella moellendorffii]|uniref:Uncharacterized protein n=1 Tax=Selaginella moellendorffii TaxID=88036 RepID=D8RC35_SELML|nr:hypothetical protein SELMODRAFT_409680 [Selaginella moellendorffii]
MDVEMNTQIDVGVIEAVGTSAPEAAGTGGGVLVSDVGGGGGAMPSVAEAVRGQVDEPAEDVIGSVVGGSTTEATRGMVAAPTAPQAGGAGGASGGEGLCMHDSDTILNDCVWDTIIQAQERTVSKVLQEMAWNGPHRFLVPLCRLVQSHWVRSAYDLNMAIYSSFAEVGFGSIAGTFIVSPTFPGTGRTDCCLGEGTGKAPEELIYNISKSKMSFAEQSVCLELLNTWLRNNEKRCEIRMEKVMKEKAYISQSIAAGEEMLQVWDEKFLSSTRTGNGWLPHGGMSLAEFKNQPGQPFLARRMVYRYLKYCPGAPVYTTGVLQKLLTRGKKLGMYEPEFYCPCTHERELCSWYLELVEQMPTSDFELDLYLECHPDVAESSHQSFRRTKTFFPSLPTATNDNLEELSSAAMHKQVRPLSPTASVGEVAVLIGDYTQLLDATSWELYMLDRWIHGLGQLTPYGKIDFIFFDLPDGMPPP